MTSNKVFYIICVFIGLISCSDKENIIPDNEPKSTFNISDIKIESYVNRLFIDIIGREPLNVELIDEVDSLKAHDLEREYREDLILRLMTDTFFSPNEGSYHEAFVQNLYNLAKVRSLQNVSDQSLRMSRGIRLGQALRDSLNMNWDGYYANLAIARKYQDVVDSRLLLLNGLINYHEMFAIMIDNPYYDVLNMNSFNFIRASFDELLWRLPTEQEYNNAFEMIEKKMPGRLFGRSGSSKDDYIEILSQSQGMLQGMVIWSYQAFLNRAPTPEEIFTIMQTYGISKDVKDLISPILVTDEYANFQ